MSPHNIGARARHKRSGARQASHFGTTQEAETLSDVAKFCKKRLPATHFSRQFGAIAPHESRDNPESAAITLATTGEFVPHVSMSGAVVFHIVDHDHKRRAQLARCAFEIGHHAEVYSDSAELKARPPREGVVIALDEAIEGGVGNLLGLLNRDGRWLTVVTTSVAPTLAKAVEAVEQGAADYLALPIDSSDLARTLSRLAQGPRAPQLRARRRARARHRLARLSRREFEVLELMARGLTNKEIGAELGISARTVEIHRTNALMKLKCGHSTDALRIWFESELEDDRQDFARAS